LNEQRWGAADVTYESIECSVNDSTKFSKHGPPAATDPKTTVVQLLNKQLADTVDLRSQARQAHFNVKGPYIQELKSLFDGLARDLRQFTDLIAEHINALGGQSVATVRSVAYESGLREYPLDAVDAHDHLEALLSGYSRYEQDTWHNIKALEVTGDTETAELLEVIAASVEKNLWFLEVYLEGIAVGLHGNKLPAWRSAFGKRRLAEEKAGSGH
jgi:starvation-inducible DNA-binding protein